MYFQIVKTKAGYHARIRGDNHEIVFQTQVYDQKASATNAITMVKNGASSARTIEADQTT
jgi:uncharacterized protein YegP (UPF0339 family)